MLTREVKDTPAGESGLTRQQELEGGDGEMGDVLANVNRQRPAVSISNNEV